MPEIIHSLFYPLSNAIMSGFMVVIFIYWIFAFLGVGLDSFDFGLDFDGPVETDLDVDTAVEHGSDIDANTHASTGKDVAEPHTYHEKSETDTSHESGDHWFVRFLKFMNVGKVPFMLVLSTLKFFTWAGSLITTQITMVGNWGWKSIIILIPCFLIGIFLTKIVTNPLAKFLKKTGYQGEDKIEFLGRRGRMFSTIEHDKLGSAEFIIEKNPIKLNVISHSGEKINYGDSVIITDESKDKKLYFVTREISLEQN